MPVKVEICEDGHVIRGTLIDPWTMEQLLEIQAVTRPHRASVDFVVHGLVDLSQTFNVPPGVLNARRLPAFSTASRGHVAVVGAGPMAHMFFDTIGKLMNFERVVYFDSEAEAMAFLRQLIADEQATSTKSNDPENPPNA